MPSTHLSLREEDVVRLALEFLHNRDLHIAQLSLERETGVINGNFADDVLFLRQLILDGQWDDVLEFIQPLGALPAFQIGKFNYAILRHKYIELLCIKSEIKAYNNVDNVVEEVVKVLNEIEKLAPSKEEYSNLCLLLTLPSITDHTSFKKWNPSNARVQCFREVYPLVEHFLPSDKKSAGTPIAKSSKNDRLIQLLIKGILYESCVNYCQTKASGTKESQSQEVSFSRLLDGCGFDESDLSLLSWLQSIPAETFGVPFEQRTLNVDVERLERPSLHTSWTEHMLVTPIKPRAFPHLAMPFRRPRSAADAMTRSLRPLPDGAPRHPALLALSAVDLGPGVHSSCFAGFHLTGIRGGIAMNASVDRLFEKDATGADSPADALQNKVIDDGNAKPTNALSPDTPENVTMPVNANISTVVSANASAASTPERRGRESPTSVAASTARSSRRDSLSERAPAMPHPQPPNVLPGIQAPAQTPDADFRRELLKEYQIQKQRECDDYIRQLCSQDNPMRDSVSDGGLASDGGATSACEERAEEQPRAVNGARGPQQQSPLQQPQVRRRDSLGIPASPPNRDLQHPSGFPSILRRDTYGGSNVSLRRDSPSPTARVNPNRYSMGSLANLRNNSFNLNRRDSIGNSFSAINGYGHNGHNAHTVNFNRRDSLHIPSNGSQVQNVRDIKRDYVGSTGNVIKKEPPVNRKLSIDSLDSRRNSWDPGRLGSISFQDCGENPSDKGIRTIKTPLGRGPSAAGARGIVTAAGARPTFRAVTVLEDLQAVRCAEFHPNGKLYAVGSNTKTLRICAYPKIDDITENHEAYPPSVLFKRTKHHKGSIYCLAWSPAGDLLATGSNDKTVKLMRFNSDTSNLEGQEVELAMHDGTVRDVCFIEDTSNKTSLLVSGGAGDCKIYVTDCATGKPFKALNGHSGHVLSLYNWGGAMFVSGSQDKTVRFWDLRTGQCVNIITPITTQGSRGSPVASLAVDPSGRLLVTGHEDGSCGLHDVRGSRPLQRLAAPHSADVRSVRFSPGAYYLLTGGYDGRLALTDLQGDLTMPLPSVVVASHPDKVISGRWHPEDFSFLSTSADKTCALWTIPPA